MDQIKEYTAASKASQVDECTYVVQSRDGGDVSAGDEVIPACTHKLAYISLCFVS